MTALHFLYEAWNMTQSPTEYQYYTEQIDRVSEASLFVQGYSVQYSVMHKGTVMDTASSIR